VTVSWNPYLEFAEGTIMLITTPMPWRSIVTVAQYGAAGLKPMFVLKNAVALWSLTDAPGDGPVDSADWARLRPRFLLHNPGLDGVLDLVDQML
jgi:hypothetical protein